MTDAGILVKITLQNQSINTRDMVRYAALTHPTKSLLTIILLNDGTV